MDPLSVTASIITVVQLTNEVIKYFNDVNDAPKECQQCVTEASNLLGPLVSLRFRAEKAQIGDPWFEQLRKLNVRDGPLDQYKQALELLRTRVDIRDGIQRVKQLVLWKLNKEQVAETLERIERLKSLVNIALVMDHRELSDAIKDDTDSIRASLPPLQASAVAIEASIDTLHTETRLVKDDTISIRTAVKDAQSLQHHEAVVKWLSPTDFPAQQHDIISHRQEGTAKWFLDSIKFKEWLQGSDRTLFCPGIPGAGKTMMAAVAISHLYQSTQNDDIGIAYLFCSYKAQVDQSVLNLFAAILKQLVQNRPDIAAPVTGIYDQHSKRGTKPSLDELTQALLSTCLSYSTVYVVIDALDECPSQNGVRYQLINTLRNLQASRNVRLLFTSRFIPEVEEVFQSNPWLEVRASREDVRRYIVGQLPLLPKCILRDEGLKNDVQTKIVEAVDGMFLLARLHLDSLLDKRNRALVLSTLDKLSKGSTALEDAYGEAIQRIEEQKNGDRLLAWRALCWISYAQRPLTTIELCHALATERDDQGFNIDKVYEIGDIISVCAGLVTVDDESGIIRLVHYTTQEYFERVRLKWNPTAQEEIAVTCVTYLSFNAFESGSCPSDKDFDQRLAENNFLDYSAHHWNEHVRQVEYSTIVSDLALDFLCNDALMDTVIQVVSVSKYRWNGSSSHFPNQTKGLHLTARYGLFHLTERFLNGEQGASNKDGDWRDGYGRTALSYAVENGHEAVVKLLLDSDKVKDGDSKDEDGRTVLRYAVVKKHEAVVKLLLDSGKVGGGNEKISLVEYL